MQGRMKHTRRNGRRGRRKAEENGHRITRPPLGILFIIPYHVQKVPIMPIYLVDKLVLGISCCK
jgi:hypothetical protein